MLQLRWPFLKIDFLKLMDLLNIEAEYWRPTSQGQRGGEDTHRQSSSEPTLQMLLLQYLNWLFQHWKKILSGASCLKSAFVNTIHCWLLYTWAACSSSCIGFDYRLGNQLSHKTRCIPPCQLPHHHPAHLHQCQCYQHSQHFASLIWKKVLITIS